MAKIYFFPNDSTDHFRKEQEWKFEYESYSPVKKIWLKVQAQTQAVVGITKTVIFSR